MIASQTKTLDEAELDKLLQGLDQLTETLPDLGQTSPKEAKKWTPTSPKMETLSANFATNSQPYNSGNFTSDSQPYHTRHDSKPFSYFRTNNTSRSHSRASNNGLQGVQPGLESPNILRKIMHVNTNGSSLNDSMSIGTDSRPLSPSGKYTSRIYNHLYHKICLYKIMVEFCFL